MSNIVYFLSNEEMPNSVKIGIATDINERMRQLYSTGVPLPFTCEYAGIVENAAEVEKALHFAFGHNRLHDRREFFEIEPSQAIVLLKLLCKGEVTPNTIKQDVSAEETKAVEARQKIRSAFNFSMVDIPLGGELHFIDEPEIIAKVVSNTKIEFNGETTSLSASAGKLLQSLKGWWADQEPKAQGPKYWVYMGETLSERRNRMENED